MKAAIRSSILATVAVIALSAGSTQIAFADGGAQSNHVGGCNPYPYPPPQPKLASSLGSIISIVGLYFGF